MFGPYTRQPQKTRCSHLLSTRKTLLSTIPLAFQGTKTFFRLASYLLNLAKTSIKSLRNIAGTMASDSPLNVVIVRLLYFAG